MERELPLDASSPLYLGIEIGGTKLQLGLGGEAGPLRALARRTVVASNGATGILRQIRESCDPLLHEAGVSMSDVEAVGVGFGGPLDSARGVVFKSHQVTGWDNFALAETLRRDLGVARVAIENDADTAALAEAKRGAGVGHDPLLYVTIGSGIGGGLIIHGEIYRGSGRGAVEIGHVWVAKDCDRDGASTRTGSTENYRLEELASGWAIDRAGGALLRSRIDRGTATGFLGSTCGDDPDAVNARSLGEAARAGDAEAGEILHEAASKFGWVLANAITLLAPSRVVLGGGVSLLGDELWLNPIREHVNSRVFRPYVGTFDIVPATLGEEVVVYGAIEVARKA